MSTDQIIQIVIAIIASGGLGAFGQSVFERRARQKRMNAETATIEEQTEAARAALFREPFAQASAMIKELSLDNDKQRAENDKLRNEMSTMWRELQESKVAAAKALVEIRELRMELPERSLAGRLDSEESREVLDKTGYCIILSVPGDNGRFVWVSRGFCILLGLTRDQFLETDWRDLCHPEDIEQTQMAESRAHGNIVEVFNRYKRITPDGAVEYIPLHWISTRYKPTAFAVALPLRREADERVI